MQIGAHTDTHQILAAAADEETIEEVQRSRAAIEAELARECWAFSYPNGERADFGEREFSALARAGFRCAFTQVPGTSAPGSFPFSLPRIPLPSVDEFRVFQSRVTGLHQFLTNPLVAFS
jgi:peptidoglycan/xylan/chitin deacetylase (PgdA/CDA1 family)